MSRVPRASERSSPASHATGDRDERQGQHRPPSHAIAAHHADDHDPEPDGQGEGEEVPGQGQGLRGLQQQAEDERLDRPVATSAAAPTRPRVATATTAPRPAACPDGQQGRGGRGDEAGGRGGQGRHQGGGGRAEGDGGDQVGRRSRGRGAGPGRLDGVVVGDGGIRSCLERRGRDTAGPHPIGGARNPRTGENGSVLLDAQPADRGDQGLRRRLAHRAQGGAAPIRLVDRDAGAVAFEGHRAGQPEPGRAIGGQRVGAAGTPGRARPRGPSAADPPATSRSASSRAACSTVSLSSRSASYVVGTAPGRSAGSTSHCTAGPTWCGIRASTAATRHHRPSRPPARRGRARADPAAARADPDPAGPAATDRPDCARSSSNTSGNGTAVHGSTPIRPRGSTTWWARSAPWTANGARSRSVGSRPAAFR